MLAPFNSDTEDANSCFIDNLSKPFRILFVNIREEVTGRTNILRGFHIYGYDQALDFQKIRAKAETNQPLRFCISTRPILKIYVKYSLIRPI
jgi:hypothetical protein